MITAVVTALLVLRCQLAILTSASHVALSSLSAREMSGAISSFAPAGKVLPALAGFFAAAFVPYYFISVRKPFGGAREGEPLLARPPCPPEAASFAQSTLAQLRE